MPVGACGYDGQDTVGSCQDVGVAGSLANLHALRFHQTQAPA